MAIKKTISMMIRQASSILLPSENIRLCAVWIQYCRTESCEIVVYVAEISPAGEEGIPVLIGPAAPGIVEYMSHVATGIYTQGLSFQPGNNRVQRPLPPAT